MSAAAVPTTQTRALTLPSSHGFALSRAVTTTTFIVAVMALAFGLRAAGLSTSGFSEDEINKVLTSASLMANAPATVNAIHRLRSRSTLGIGVHLMLVDGAPMHLPDRVPTLLRDDGRFYPSWRPFIVACLTGRVSMEEVERELAAQIGRVIDEGIRPTHLDTHKHVHVYPPIFAIVAGLAERFRIPVVRVPYEGTLADSPLFLWSYQDYRMATSHGIRAPQFIGRLMTGTMTPRSLTTALRRLRPGHTELMVHPGYVDEALRHIQTRLLRSRSDEVALLTSPEIGGVLAAERIRLVRPDLTPVDLLRTGSYCNAS
jgi:predicted glycoside hydrolase/deacetylase ChbG (UPF0249 family)